MPQRDGTGPMGTGRMAGRGLGLCADTGAVRYGGGYGWGLGLGLACRRGFGGRFAGRNAVSRFDPATQKDLLTRQKSILQQRLEDIEKELENL